MMKLRVDKVAPVLLRYYIITNLSGRTEETVTLLEKPKIIFFIEYGIRLPGSYIARRQKLHPE